MKKRLLKSWIKGTFTVLELLVPVIVTISFADRKCSDMG